MTITVERVTVTDVELTADLRIAYVFVTTMEQDAAERDVFAGLSKASGFVRAELGRRLTLRYLPEIVFKKDMTGPRGDRVLQQLDELHIEDEQAGLVYGHEVPVHFRVGHGQRAAGVQLALEDLHHAAAAAQDVAEPHRGQFDGGGGPSRGEAPTRRTRAG